MKPSKFILPLLLLMAFLCCWLLVLSSPPSRIHFVNVPAASPPSARIPNYAVTGILTNPNFQKVLHALEQRSGIQALTEPEVTTIRAGAVNQVYYRQTFILPVTKQMIQ
jgi:hypothetical protein